MTDKSLRIYACHAIGTGIGMAFAAAEEQESPDTPEAWVHFCLRAALEAHAAALEAPPKAQPGVIERLLEEFGDLPESERPTDHKAAEAGAHEAARMAFRCCMPRLTGRRMTQAYIACVAAGVQHRYFSGSEATSLLYTAQLALTAYPSRRAQRGKKGNN